MDCPKCNQSFENDINAYGLLVCPECQWVGQQVDPGQSMNFYLNRGTQILIPVMIIVVFSLISFEFIMWKKFSLDVMVLQAKSILRMDTLQDHLEKGAICNALEEYSCSIEEFNYVVQAEPKHQKALANLAIAFSQLNQWKKARPHFNAYFSLGGHGYDVMYWYAKALGQLETPEKALYWYYYSLAVNPKYGKAADALVSELLRFGRNSEALSVIASMTNGLPERSEYWKGRVSSIASYVTRKPDEVTNVVQTYRELKSTIHLPALDGQTYYAPIKVGAKGKVNFFVVNPKSAYLLLPRDVLARNNIMVPKGAAKVSFKTIRGTGVGKMIRLKSIELGPWKFKNIAVAICERCQPTLGRSLLSKLDLNSWNRHETSFLTLSRKE